MICIGIDNGADGGIVAIDGRRIVLAEIAPVIDIGRKNAKTGKIGVKRIPDIPRMAALMRKIVEDAGDPDQCFGILERAQVMPKEGAVTAFAYGRGFGAWEACLACFRIPYELKTPNEWGLVLKGVEGEDTKARAVLRCSRSLPDLQLTLPGKRKPHSGLADAAAMALFAHALHRTERA